MKKFRQITTNPISMIILLISFLNLSCNQDDAIELRNANYDGKELFKSIILLDGEYTSKIPTLNSIKINSLIKSNVDKIEYENFKNEAISFILQENPNFMDNFKNDILSKDPIVISEAIKSSHNVMAKFLDYKLRPFGLTAEKISTDIKNIPTEELNQDSLNDIYNSANGKCVYQVAGLVVLLVAAIVAVVAAAVTTWVDEGTAPIGKSSKKQILIEEVAISIAENF